MALSEAEAPGLHAVTVQADGSMVGWDEVEAAEKRGEMAEGGVVLLAQLLGLLVTFVGESLTLRMLRETWPAAAPADFDFGKGDNV